MVMIKSCLHRRPLRFHPLGYMYSNACVPLLGRAKFVCTGTSNNRLNTNGLRKKNIIHDTSEKKKKTLPDILTCSEDWIYLIQ